MANSSINLHDWELRGLLVLEQQALARFAFNDLRKVVVFEGLTALVIDEVFAKNIVYDLVCIASGDPKHDESLLKLRASIHAGTPYDPEVTQIYALRSSVGADGLIACRSVREGTQAEWLAGAQA